MYGILKTIRQRWIQNIQKIYHRNKLIKKSMHLIFKILTNKSADLAHEYRQGLITNFTGPRNREDSGRFRDGKHPLFATQLFMLFLFYVLTFPYIMNVHDKVPVTHIPPWTSLYLAQRVFSHVSSPLLLQDSWSSQANLCHWWRATMLSWSCIAPGSLYLILSSVHNGFICLSVIDGNMY